MTDSYPQVQSGSLSARVIRACRIHNNKCKLDCPKRQVEDLGEIAKFDFDLEKRTLTERISDLPEPSEGIRTGTSNIASLIDQIKRRFT